jgi:vancomycin resistance protein VanJ
VNSQTNPEGLVYSIAVRRFAKTLTAIYLVFLALYVILRFTVGDAIWWLSLLNTFAFLLFLPLPLALITAQLQKTSWLRWLSVGVTLVALVWFGGYFIPKSVPSVQGQEVTLLTFNMQSKDELLEPLLRTELIDIVLLQEISKEYTQSVESLLDLYPYQFSQSEQWGNKVLSRYPITKAEDLQGFGPSLPQRLELNINGQKVAVYNLHLTWPIGNPRLNLPLPGFILKAVSGFDDRPRNEQINLLIEHLQNEPLPYLVAGDFNLSQYTATYNKLVQIANDSFREAEFGFGNTWPATMQSGLNLPPLLRLDYVWHSDHFQSVNVKREQGLGSDHFPVFASFILK